MEGAGVLEEELVAPGRQEEPPPPPSSFGRSGGGGSNRSSGQAGGWNAASGRGSASYGYILGAQTSKLVRTPVAPPPPPPPSRPPQVIEEAPRPLHLGMPLHTARRSRHCTSAPTIGKTSAEGGERNTQRCQPCAENATGSASKA